MVKRVDTIPAVDESSGMKPFQDKCNFFNVLDISKKIVLSSKIG